MKINPYLICMVLGSQDDACEDHIYVGWQVKYFGIGHQTLRRFVYFYETAYRHVVEGCSL